MKVSNISLNFVQTLIIDGFNRFLIRHPLKNYILDIPWLDPKRNNVKRIESLSQTQIF